IRSRPQEWNDECQKRSMSAVGAAFHEIPYCLTSRNSFLSASVAKLWTSFQEKNGEHKQEQVPFVFLFSYSLVFHGLGANQALSARPGSRSSKPESTS